MEGALDSRDLGGFSDRLIDLKKALERLYDSNSANKYLLGLEETADAARALFADDPQTKTLSLNSMPPPNRDYEPMLQQSEGYEYMDDKVKARMYWLQDMYYYTPKVFFFHNGVFYEGCHVPPAHKTPPWPHNMEVQAYKLVPAGPKRVVVDAAWYRAQSSSLPAIPKDAAPSDAKRRRM